MGDLEKLLVNLERGDGEWRNMQLVIRKSFSECFTKLGRQHDTIEKLSKVVVGVNERLGSRLTTTEVSKLIEDSTFKRKLKHEGKVQEQMDQLEYQIAKLNTLKIELERKADLSSLEEGLHTKVDKADVSIRNLLSDSLKGDLKNVRKELAHLKAAVCALQNSAADLQRQQAEDRSSKDEVKALGSEFRTLNGKFALYPPHSVLAEMLDRKTDKSENDRGLSAKLDRSYVAPGGPLDAALESIHRSLASHDDRLSDLTRSITSRPPLPPNHTNQNHVRYHDHEGGHIHSNMNMMGEHKDYNYNSGSDNDDYNDLLPFQSGLTPIKPHRKAQSQSGFGSEGNSSGNKKNKGEGEREGEGKDNHASNSNSNSNTSNNSNSRVLESLAVMWEKVEGLQTQVSKMDNEWFLQISSNGANGSANKANKAGKEGEGASKDTGKTNNSHKKKEEEDMEEEVEEGEQEVSEEDSDATTQGGMYVRGALDLLSLRLGSVEEALHKQALKTENTERSERSDKGGKADNKDTDRDGDKDKKGKTDVAGSDLSDVVRDLSRRLASLERESAYGGVSTTGTITGTGSTGTNMDLPLPLPLPRAGSSGSGLGLGGKLEQHKARLTKHEDSTAHTLASHQEMIEQLSRRCDRSERSSKQVHGLLSAAQSQVVSLQQREEEQTQAAAKARDELKAVKKQTERLERELRGTEKTCEGLRREAENLRASAEQQNAAGEQERAADRARSAAELERVEGQFQRRAVAMAQSQAHVKGPTSSSSSSSSHYQAHSHFNQSPEKGWSTVPDKAYGGYGYGNGNGGGSGGGNNGEWVWRSVDNRAYADTAYTYRNEGPSTPTPMGQLSSGVSGGRQIQVGAQTRTPGSGISAALDARLQRLQREKDQLRRDLGK